MKYLLDTHVFLWAVTADPKLSSRAKQIFTGDHELWFSVAGVWEILTKVEIGKLDGLQKRLPATVVRFPFYDPEKTRPRS